MTEELRDDEPQRSVKVHTGILRYPSGALANVDDISYVTEAEYRRLERDLYDRIEEIRLLNEVAARPSTAPNLAAAVLAYDAAIHSCANDPEKMASFCSAQGDDLDALYFAMVSAARSAPSPLAPPKSEAMAWAVHQRPGSEFDVMIYPDLESARMDVDADAEDEEQREIIPLYPASDSAVSHIEPKKPAHFVTSTDAWTAASDLKPGESLQIGRWAIGDIAATLEYYEKVTSASSAMVPLAEVQRVYDMVGANIREVTKNLRPHGAPWDISDHESNARYNVWSIVHEALRPIVHRLVGSSDGGNDGSAK